MNQPALPQPRREEGSEQKEQQVQEQVQIQGQGQEQEWEQGSGPALEGQERELLQEEGDE